MLQISLKHSYSQRKVIVIHVALDTSIYRRNPQLNSPEFKALFSLAKDGCVCLHIPFFVENEFNSYIKIEQKKRVESVLAGLDKICKFPNPGPKTASLIELRNYLSEFKEEIINECGNNFTEWKSEIKAKKYGLSDQETKEALLAYFYGNPPLKEPKVRNDIPDSFIFQSLLNVNIHANEGLCVVIADKKLREACLAAGMTCYNDLSEFIGSEEIKLLLKDKIDINVLSKLESQIGEFLNNHKMLLAEKIEEKLLSSEYNMISGDFIPGESNEIYVSGVNEPYAIEVSNDIKYYGDSRFVADFHAKVEFTYEYAVYKSDAYDLDAKKYYLEFLNDHYFNVETTDEFTFKGKIEIKLDDDIDLEATDLVANLMDSLFDPEISIDGLEDFKINA